MNFDNQFARVSQNFESEWVSSEKQINLKSILTLPQPWLLESNPRVVTPMSSGFGLNSMPNIKCIGT